MEESRATKEVDVVVGQHSNVGVQQERLSDEKPVEVTTTEEVKTKEADKWVPPPQPKRFRDKRGVIYVKNADGSLRREVPVEKKNKAEKKKEQKDRHKTT